MVEKTVMRRLLTNFWARQAAHAGFILLGVSLVTFVLMSLVPGDPAEMMLSGQHESPSAENIARLRRELGLDQPLPVQYLKWLGRVLTLDFGNSLRTGDPVIREILRRFPTTLILALGAFGFVVVVSTAGGVVSAVFQNRLPDKCCRAWTILAVSIPDYWLGLILILIFSLKLRWFPVTGNDGLNSYVLPILTLGIAASAAEGRVLRAGVLETLTQDYVKFARSKGLSRFRVLTRHVLKISLLPMIALWGVVLGHLLGGAVIAESVFSLPGLGKLAVDAVLSRDLPMIQGTVLIMTLMFVLAGQSMEIVYRMLDPRIRRR